MGVEGGGDVNGVSSLRWASVTAAHPFRQASTHINLQGLKYSNNLNLKGSPHAHSIRHS